jgi:hypothetical protein
MRLAAGCAVPRGAAKRAPGPAADGGEIRQSAERDGAGRNRSTTSNASEARSGRAPSTRRQPRSRHRHRTPHLRPYLPTPDRSRPSARLPRRTRPPPRLPACPCRHPASCPSASHLGCLPDFSGMSRKGGPARSGGPPFLERPRGRAKSGPEAGRRPVRLLRRTPRSEHQETNTRERSRRWRMARRLVRRLRKRSLAWSGRSPIVRSEQESPVAAGARLPRDARARGSGDRRLPERGRAVGTCAGRVDQVCVGYPRRLTARRPLPQACISL